MEVAVVAIGTELLLGQIVDSNSARIGQMLAANGFSSHLQLKVGDNHERIVAALELALRDADAVITSGGLGPTQDDITREAIAEFAQRPLREDAEVRVVIEELFAQRGRPMSANNYRQALVPDGATIIAQRKGTAPGLIVPVGEKVIFALPGVPYELDDMLAHEVLAELRARRKDATVIRSRVLRTWGLGESRLAELMAPRFEELEGSNVTIAFLASGIEGVKVRFTVNTTSEEEAAILLDREEAQARGLLGDAIFGVDDDTLESVVAQLALTQGISIAVAESLTGGMVASQLVRVPGASRWFRGGVVSYATAVKEELLGVKTAAVVSEEAACSMAEGVARLLGSELGVATTGVAGPEMMEGQAVGTVWIGMSLRGHSSARRVQLLGDRERIRTYATATALDLVRLTLSGSARGFELAETDVRR
ncbi:MAG: competence/damage-inducible protein A [Ferrimicrobium sp.]